MRIEPGKGGLERPSISGHGESTRAHRRHVTPRSLERVGQLLDRQQFVKGRLRHGRQDSRVRATHKTFEDYCREKWGIERRQAYRLIDASEVSKNVSQGTQTQPTTERQARPLTKLPPVEQPKAWERGRDSSSGMGVPMCEG